MAQTCIVVRPHNASALLGISYQRAAAYLRKLREAKGKKAGEFVSIGEFAAYSGIPELEVRKALQ